MATATLLGILLHIAADWLLGFALFRLQQRIPNKQIDVWQAYDAFRIIAIVLVMFINSFFANIFLCFFLYLPITILVNVMMTRNARQVSTNPVNIITRDNESPQSDDIVNDIKSDINNIVRTTLTQRTTGS